MKYFTLVLLLSIPLISFSQNDVTIEVPKILSFNSGTDNIFKIKSSNVPYEVIHFKVFSRWGNEIYVSKSNDAAWDGTEKGKNVPSGTYYYSIKLKLENRKKQEFTGFVTVM
jgi:gliding motility-associated-like protein